MEFCFQTARRLSYYLLIAMLGLIIYCINKNKALEFFKDKNLLVVLDSIFLSHCPRSCSQLTVIEFNAESSRPWKKERKEEEMDESWAAGWLK